MNVTTDNPAGRLYRLLEKAKSLKGNGFAIWEQVFGINREVNEERRQFEVIGRLIQTQDLIDDVEKALLAVNAIDPEPYVV